MNPIDWFVDDYREGWPVILVAVLVAVCWVAVDAIRKRQSR